MDEKTQQFLAVAAIVGILLYYGQWGWAIVVILLFIL